MNPKSVVIGISGGVDSAVAACLLKRAGYRVTGLNIRVLDTLQEPESLQPSPIVISDLEEYRIPVFSLNLSMRFARQVIGYFRNDYLSGRTPNPCMICNKNVKWHGLLEGARLLGADLVATGHYARTSFTDSRYRLFKGADRRKDQSYFLWMLSESDLERTLLPLGDLTKPEVRDLARSMKVRTSEKKESQDICFVPDGDYQHYLKTSLPGLEKSVSGGEIIDRNGTVIGHHRGYPFYTIGQRRGLGISTPEPHYVTGIDPQKNRLRVGVKSDLECLDLTISGLNWIGIEPPRRPFASRARIRYRDVETPCTVHPLDHGRAGITFRQAKHAVTPGQALVLYRGDELLGGGFIDTIQQP